MARVRKQLKSQRKYKTKSLPRHVKRRAAEMSGIEGVIRNLLGSFAQRVVFFEAPVRDSKPKRRKSTRKKRSQKHRSKAKPRS